MKTSNNIYGVLNRDGVHIDVSKTERGAKRYASLNGYNKVSVRYNAGYIVAIVSEKLSGRWVNVS